MIKRTTIELDEELVAQAKRALGKDTIRETVEEALRQAAERAGAEQARRAERQKRFLERLSGRIDVEVLASEQMWR